MELIHEGKFKPVIDKVLPLGAGARGPAPDPGPRGHRQGRGGAVTRATGYREREMTVDKVQELITRAPYHQWLGLKVIAVHDDGIELTATWREEWVVNPERRYTHGGVLAALVDLGADWAMVKKLGRARADHRPARRLSRRRHAGRPDCARQDRPHGRPVLDCAEAHIYDAQGKLLASGRGTYFTAPPEGVITIGFSAAPPRPSPNPPPRTVRDGAVDTELEAARRWHRDTRLHQSRRSDPSAIATSTRSPSSISAAKRRRANSAIAGSTGWRMASRARWPSAAWRAATASPSCRPIARNISPPISASCARVCRGAGELQVSAARPSISSCAIPAPSWCSATRSGARTARPGLPVVCFGGEGAESFDTFLDPGPFETLVVPIRTSRRCSSTRPARPARRRASCSRTRATSGWWRRGSRTGSTATAI